MPPMTERGRQLKTEVLPIADDLDRSLREPFESGEIAVFERVLDSLADVIEAPTKEEV